MPVIFQWKGYKFFFFSNEGSPSEARHVHVRKEAAIAKFWIQPEVKLADSWGMSARELNTLKRVVEDNANLIKETWNEFFKN